MNDNTLYDDLLLATAALLEEHEYKKAIAKKEEEKQKEEEKITEAEEKLSILRKGPGKATKVLAIVFTALALFFLTMTLIFLSFAPGGEIASAFLFGMCGVPAIVFVIVSYKRGDSYKTASEEAAQEYKKCTALVAKNTQKIDSEIVKLRQKLDDKHFECLKLTKGLPVAYSDLFSVSYMLMLVTNQRCDTIKEAINMLELERRHHQLLSALQVISTKLGYINSALSQVKACLSNLNTNVKKMKAIETLEFLES